MKISEVTPSTIKEYLKLDNNYEDNLLLLIIIGAKSYILSYTGQTIEFIDTKEDLTIAYLALIADMYDNRSIIVEKDKVNKLIDTILNMYCVNLL